MTPIDEEVERQRAVANLVREGDLVLRVRVSDRNNAERRARSSDQRAHRQLLVDRAVRLERNWCVAPDRRRAVARADVVTAIRVTERTRNGERWDIRREVFH